MLRQRLDVACAFGEPAADIALERRGGGLVVETEAGGFPAEADERHAAAQQRSGDKQTSRRVQHVTAAGAAWRREYQTEFGPTVILPGRIVRRTP